MTGDRAREDSLRVLGFAGSLRRDSLNRKLLSAAVELAPAAMKIEAYDIREIPLYNFDVEQVGDPPPVTAFKDAIRGADALLIATPEYQHGVPGVLKNALDWAARPPGRSALQGKAVAIMGASPGFTGTARAQSQLREVFGFSAAYAVLQPEVLVGRAPEKFDAEGRLTDMKTIEVVRRLLDQLVILARLLQGERSIK